MRNAYLTVAEADAYHEIRPSKAKWQAAGDGKAGFLVAASDYLDAMFGLPPDLVASMRGSGEIPPAVQKAVAELSLIGNLIQGGGQAEQKSLTKGGMTASYGGKSEHAERLAYVRQLLKPLVGRSIRNVRVKRG